MTASTQTTYVPPLELTAGQPAPIAANGGLSYMSFDQDGDAGTRRAISDALALIEGGDLVPDEIILSIIEKKLSNSDCNNGFILDGFPRTLNQAIALEKILEKHEISIDKIIEINVKEEILLQRITSRAIETNNNRADDNSDVLKNRIEIYNKDTKPVLKFYDNMGKLITVNGMLSIEEVSKEILNLL